MGRDGESGVEWTTVQHLDLRHVGRGLKPLQPHAAAFHPTQAVLAVAVGTHIIEFDALTGSKICSVNIGARVVRMSYSPTTSHAIISILEDCTIRSCDFDTEQTLVLYSPEKRTDQISSETDVHLALTPLQPVVFFGFHKRMSVTVVGTIEGGRAPTKIKTDLKKPIINLACHPRLPVLYVAYADGLIRAYNIHTYAVLYTLQYDNTIKLIGAGAFAFHPTLEWVFIGDRRGTLLAWDVSTERPNMIGITQVGSHPIKSIAWLPTLCLLVTVSMDGLLQVWRTHIIVNPNKQPMQTNFFEHADVKSIDIPKILSLQDGEFIYPLPKIKNIAVHPKLNLAVLLFTDLGSGDSLKSRAAYSREGRKQLFAVLQSARGSTATILKEKLSSLGSSGILADHQLQTQLQEYQSKDQNQLTITDIARKAFLYSHFMEGHAKSGPITQLPLLTISNIDHQLKDIPLCLPFHLELNFFNKENRVLQYPVRTFYLDEVNLMSFNLSSGVPKLHKRLYSSVPGNVDFHPKTIVYSSKQHMFLVVFEIRNGNSTDHEVVIYWEQTDVQSVNSKLAKLKGRDVALIGTDENQYAILGDAEKTDIVLYTLSVPAPKQDNENNGALDANSFSEGKVGQELRPVQLSFETEVDRIFSSPLESTILYAINGNHIGLAKLIQGYRLSSDGGQYISTNTDGKKSIKLKLHEIAHQVQWQETLRGHVAGILTSRRILIISKDLDILSSSSIKFDKGLPSFHSLLWVGPSLLFSSATAISMLGWDSKVRKILSNSLPYAALLGVLNDRILLVNPTDIKKGVEIRSCHVGLLEPLLIGFVTMQQHFEQKLDLSEILYQITSRFDNLRITPRSLDILAKGPPDCGDLAVSLSLAGPQFTQVLRCIYAIKARRFSTALSVLKDEFLRSRDYPQCPPTSHLFHRFRQLGYACIKYSQFDSAKETFEAIADFQSLLDLFICHFNPSAMRRLAQKLEETSTDSELRRYCERILRVRSTGWTQGIFANFAAESMVPKGPEWGGGNWEIKTPSNQKAIPQWDLAGEVMPYMRTSEGSIPSIIAEHIGVYLGAIKGRENVVEVSEKSLVRTLLMANSENNLPSSLPNPASDKMKNIMSNDTKDDSITDTLSKQLAGGTSSITGDEQVKAAEEFKKSLYGTANGSSSDEDESTSKSKKILINIGKPVASMTVDVDKIKEATKQFKLGEAPMKTRASSGGSQDLSFGLSQPTPASAAIPLNTNVTSDLFGKGFTALTPQTESSSMVTAMGSTPIPEDFFQNTISSLQIAASMPVPPSYVNKLDQSNSGIAGSQLVSNQMGKPITNVGLPDGGVPPQASQLSSAPVDSIGLPDGGVPPQSVVQAPLPPGTSQPLDISVLEGSGSLKSPPQHPPPVPSSVRPGQVPRGASASVCFKTGLVHLEQNQLTDALSCLDEGFLALAKDQSRDADIKAQATICAQYKIAVSILEEIARLQKVQGANAISAKDEMARLSRHLGSLPLLTKHRISCIRTSIKRNMEVQNYAYAKERLELLLSKAPTNKQDELRTLIDMCTQRGLSNKCIDPFEDPSQFCAATLSRLSTIGYDICDLCGSKFSALMSPGCIICGMGSIKRSDSSSVVAVPSPFG